MSTRLHGDAAVAVECRGTPGFDEPLPGMRWRRQWSGTDVLPRSFLRYNENARGRAGGPRTRHAARLDRYRLCARLYRTFVRGRELWGPDPAIRSRWSITALHLSALARNLLHLLDVLWFCRPRLTDRIRLFDDLCGPGPHDRFLLTGHHAHRAARENPEHHIDR